MPYMTEPADSTLDYLALGHVAADVRDDGTVALGGAVSYAARTAAALGLRAGIVTRSASGFPPPHALPGVACRSVPSTSTTSFRNRYSDGGHRVQVLVDLAPPLRPADIPPHWRRVRILHLAPIVHEVGPDVAATINADFVGLTPQGWLRRLAVGSQVERETVSHIPRELLARADAVVLSEEDVGGDHDQLRWLATRVPVLVATRGPEGAVAFARGQVIEVPAAPAAVVDPTGTGDVFAAAFFIRYHETGDSAIALRFAAAAAALSIEAEGLAGIGDRAATEARMRSVVG